MKKQRKQYSAEFKREAEGLVAEHGYSYLRQAVVWRQIKSKRIQISHYVNDAF
jgi:transposase-like protein